MLPYVSSLNDADFLAGSLILVDKPKGWTSFDVVNKIRWLLRKKYNVKNIKVGHSGTLDPMATGLLLLCTGKYTKELHHLTGLDKKYTGEITLGIETATYDAEGEIIFEKEVPVLTREEIETILSQFKGEIDQYPPAYSAIKKDGKPAYLLARKGRDVVLEPRPINISAFDVHVEQMPVVRFRVVCSTGTYIRSLANDFGRALGCGAYLSSLCRTRIGEFKLEDAKSVEDWVKEIQEVLQESQNG